MAVGISKGAFYAYYPSREAGLYEVLNRSKDELFARMETIMSKKLRGKERMERFFYDVYLAPDSVLLHIPPAEFELLIDKLPPDYQESERARVNDYFQRSLESMQIADHQMETVALLTDCISMVATSTFGSDSGRKQTIDVLIGAMADYLGEEGKND